MEYIIIILGADEEISHEKTYHHLVDGFHDVVHFVPRDVAVVVHVVQSECPWRKETIKCLGICTSALRSMHIKEDKRR